MDTMAAEAEQYKEIVSRIHDSGKQCLLALPQIFRREAMDYWDRKKKWILEAGFDGYLIRYSGRSGDVYGGEDPGPDGDGSHDVFL